jgi:signal transduction histidine kinase
MDYLIKNQRIVFQAEPIDMKAFLQERISYFTEVAAMKEIRLITLHSDDVTIMFNPTQLQRIIDNNLSNAIKYSHPQSSVEISLHILKEGCQLQFKDYGLGMKHPEQIFERYYRESTQVGGFGIGLNIVKSIIDQYKIILHVDSVFQKGSTFTYLFPEDMMHICG